MRTPGRALTDARVLVATEAGRPGDGTDLPAQTAVSVTALAERGRRVNVNDLWIAATAVAQGLPIVTRDEDFDPLDGVRGLVVVRV